MTPATAADARHDGNQPDACRSSRTICVGQRPSLTLLMSGEEVKPLERMPVLQPSQ